jgi:predicted nucleic acid-binding Zn ribbon protein
VPEEADWQRRARQAAGALADAKADARAKGVAPPGRGAARRPAPPASASPSGSSSPSAPTSSPDSPPSSASPSPDSSSSPAVPPVPAGRARAGGARRPRRGGRARREDPQPLSAAFDGLLADQGWRTAAAVGSVFGRWEQLVGPDMAAHTRPERFSDGELVVIADSAAWATQVRLLTSTVVRRLNAELGHGTVTRVVVRGPAPPRRMGPLRVRGTRKRNDDYG